MQKQNSISVHMIHPTNRPIIIKNCLIKKIKSKGKKCIRQQCFYLKVVDKSLYLCARFLF